MIKPKEYNKWLAQVELATLHLVSLDAFTNAPPGGEEGSEVHPQEVETKWTHIGDARQAFLCTIGLAVNVVPVGAAPVDAGNDDDCERVIGQVIAHWHVVYADPSGTMSDAHFKVFRDNAIAHVWPLFRQQVRTVTSDFGWKPVVLPMRMHRCP